jgi:hypothetical protein
MSDCTDSESGGDLIVCFGELVDLAPNGGVVLAPNADDDLTTTDDGKGDDVDGSGLVRSLPLAGAGAGEEEEGVPDREEAGGTGGIERTGGGAAREREAGSAGEPLCTRGDVEVAVAVAVPVPVVGERCPLGLWVSRRGEEDAGCA